MILFLFLLLFTLIFSYKRYRNALQPEKNGVLVRLYRGRKKRLYIKKKHRRRIGVPCACPGMKKNLKTAAPYDKKRTVSPKKNGSYCTGRSIRALTLDGCPLIV